jgi:hypothetical protein
MLLLLLCQLPHMQRVCERAVPLVPRFQYNVSVFVTACLVLPINRAFFTWAWWVQPGREDGLAHFAGCRGLPGLAAARSGSPAGKPGLQHAACRHAAQHQLQLQLQPFKRVG